MPDALEFPRVLRAIVPLVRGERLSSLFGRRVVDEFVALAFLGALLRSLLLAWRRARLSPSLAAVIGTLDDLPEPSAGLRGVDPVWIRRRSFQVIKLPSGEMGPAHVPLFAFSIRREHERSFVGAHQNSHFAHPFSPSFCSMAFCSLAFCGPGGAAAEPKSITQPLGCILPELRHKCNLLVAYGHHAARSQLTQTPNEPSIPASTNRSNEGAANRHLPMKFFRNAPPQALSAMN